MKDNAGQMNGVPNEPSMTHKPTLLTLPSEIRRNIWKFVRTPYRINILVQTCFKGEREYDPVVRVKNFETGVLRVCSQVYDEVTEVIPEAIISIRGNERKQHKNGISPDEADEQLFEQFAAFHKTNKDGKDHGRFELQDYTDASSSADSINGEGDGDDGDDSEGFNCIPVDYLAATTKLIVESSAVGSVIDLGPMVEAMPRLESINIIAEGYGWDKAFSEVWRNLPTECPLHKQEYQKQLLKQPLRLSGEPYMIHQPWAVLLHDFLRERRPSFPVRARKLVLYRKVSRKRPLGVLGEIDLVAVGRS